MVLVVRNLPANAGDMIGVGLIPALERYPRRGNGDQLHYSCLENPMTVESGRVRSTGSQRVGHN